ncbi:MAG: dihydroneopterin aldolase [Gammaproteobacteria bacterium]|jgi:dihydroneopterin aldolase
MDIVFLSDFRVPATIGIYDWERRVKQTLIIDLEMGTDVARAARTDQIDDALNYKNVAKRVSEFVSESEFQLVETLAERIADVVRTEFNVPWVKLRLNKRGAISGASDVGIQIERGERAQ